ncbi:hypothetical protein HELRODRAFT_162214 [Helobdella robusta]|uniref:Uncharacterized protein n=1 Tax=Helobdella robusta TaxID=6412 RepID=T1ESC9_HELRO|nr:hypothetical protein HELRODRAFT_162214 [Helobdella robusta]ESN98759.1 hypothetical protein HELRODRAFT_162214 [Helobdella robusta]
MLKFVTTKLDDPATSDEKLKVTNDNKSYLNLQNGDYLLKQQQHDRHKTHHQHHRRPLSDVFHHHDLQKYHDYNEDNRLQRLPQSSHIPLPALPARCFKKLNFTCEHNNDPKEQLLHNLSLTRENSILQGEHCSSKKFNHDDDVNDVNSEYMAKHFDQLSDDSGIASNGAISEVPTPDPSDQKLNEFSLQNGDCVCEQNNENYDAFRVSNGRLKNNLNVEETCIYSPNSVENIYRNVAVNRSEPVGSRISSALHEHDHEHNLNDIKQCSSLKSNVLQVVCNEEKPICNGNINFAAANTIRKRDDVSKKLTSSLSVEEKKSHRYEKSSQSSLCYLPCVVNVHSTSQDRIMKMKERHSQQYKQQHTCNTSENKNTTSLGGNSIRRNTLKVGETETSFIVNMQQTTQPRIKTLCHESPFNKFKVMLNRNNQTNHCRPTKLPAFQQSISYDYHEKSNNTNFKFNEGNIKRPSSVRSDSLNSEDVQGDFIKRQNFVGVFNSLTRFFKRKTKLNESTSVQTQNMSQSLKKMNPIMEDLKNDYLTKPNKRKIYCSDSNLNAVTTSSQLDESNNIDFNSPMASRELFKLSHNYEGAQTMKQYFSDFNKWSSFLMKFAKTEQSSIILNEEKFQIERSKFKRSIRNFIIHAKEAIVNRDLKSEFEKKICRDCSTSFAQVVACCCLVLDYISVGIERLNMAEMVCRVGKIFYIIVSLYIGNKNHLKSIESSSAFYKKVDLLIECSKNLAIHVEALKYTDVTKLL